MSTFDPAPPRLAAALYKRFALAGLLIVLFSGAAVATAALLEVKDVADVFDRISSPIAGIQQEGVLDDVDPGGPQTVVVLGSDRRFSDIKAKLPARSDTIILMRLDPEKGATAVMSIPRDLRVDIPGVGRNKINAAYSEGGPQLTVKTLRQLLGIPINHVVNINFGGFSRAVNRLGCVYTDIDRRYFNDNNPPAGGGEPYAAIDIPAGYQRLCGQDSLDYVRFRHLDNDLVRAARQQDYLRAAKDQIGVSRLFSDRKTLLRIFATYTQTDIRGEAAILRLLKLTLESAKNPIQEVGFTKYVEEEGSDLVVSRSGLEKIRERFMNAKGTTGARAEAKKTAKDRSLERKQRKRRSGDLPPGLFNAKTAGEDNAIQLAVKAGFPVYYPKLAVVGSQYVTSAQRTYTIADRGGNRYKAYRMVVSAPGVGQYYGVQGTTWKAPPILDNPSSTRTVGGRKLLLFNDGDRLRLVAWKTDRAVYWISNTLLQSLTNRQMLGLAESLARPGT